MNLILSYVKEINPCDVIAVVTADSRGDYIEEVMQEFGGKALRLNFSSFNLNNYKYLKTLSCEKNIVAIAMDGPLGPAGEPKKLPFYLSNYSNKKIIGIKVEYKKVLKLRHRWDNYVIPVPGCNIKITFIDFGLNSSEDNFSFLKNKIKIAME